MVSNYMDVEIFGILQVLGFAGYIRAFMWLIS